MGCSLRRFALHSGTENTLTRTTCTLRKGSSRNVLCAHSTLPEISMAHRSSPLLALSVHTASSRCTAATAAASLPPMTSTATSFSSVAPAEANASPVTHHSAYKSDTGDTRAEEHLRTRTDARDANNRVIWHAHYAIVPAVALGGSWTGGRGRRCWAENPQHFTGHLAGSGDHDRDAGPGTI